MSKKVKISKKRGTSGNKPKGMELIDNVIKRFFTVASSKRPHTYDNLDLIVGENNIIPSYQRQEVISNVVSNLNTVARVWQVFIVAVYEREDEYELEHCTYQLRTTSKDGSNIEKLALDFINESDANYRGYMIVTAPNDTFDFEASLNDLFVEHYLSGAFETSAVERIILHGKLKRHMIDHGEIT